MTMTKATSSKPNDRGAVSGDRNCGFDSSFRIGRQLQCPTKGFFHNEFHLEGHDLPGKFKSWEACAKQCRKFLQWKCNYWAWHVPTKECKLVKSLSLTCQDDDEYFDRCTGGDVDEEWITGDRLCNVEKGRD